MKNICRSLVLLTLYFAFGCESLTLVKQKADTDSETLILAHRASSGLWLQNSRFAVVESIRSFTAGDLKGRFHGLEIDIVLTKDGMPVLSHDPWVHQSFCTRTDGKPLAYVLIKDVSFEELTNDYRCGGGVDPEFPNAKSIKESILGFDELINHIRSAPDLMVYLDVKIQDGLTRSAQDYAKAIFERWDKAGLVNTLYVEGPDVAALSAYRQYARKTYISVLSYPPFYSHVSGTKTAVNAAIKTILHSADALNKVIQADADAVVSPVQVVTSRSMEKLHGSNKAVIVFSLNDQKSFDKACSSGVDLIISDFPNLGPCP